MDIVYKYGKKTETAQTVVPPDAESNVQNQKNHIAEEKDCAL